MSVTTAGISRRKVSSPKGKDGVSLLAGAGPAGPRGCCSAVLGEPRRPRATARKRCPGDWQVPGSVRKEAATTKSPVSSRDSISSPLNGGNKNTHQLFQKQKSPEGRKQAEKMKKKTEGENSTADGPRAAPPPAGYTQRDQTWTSELSHSTHTDGE